MYWSLGPLAANMLRDPGSAKLFFRNGKPLAKGDTYRNPDLADMLQQLAEKGSANDFYHGEIGRKIAAAFKKNGGIVTADDMANYRAVEDAPLVLDWRGHSIATAPLTAGGLTVLQTIATLKALEADWSKFAKTDPRYTQTWLEALASPGAIGCDCLATRSSSMCRSSDCCRKSTRSNRPERFGRGRGKTAGTGNDRWPHG